MIIILAVQALSAWRMSDLSNIESTKNIIPKLQNISLQNKGAGTGNQYQEFIDSEGKFQIEYPANWLGVNSAEILAALTPPEWAEKYDLKTLFLAQDFQGGKFAQLIIYNGTFNMPIEEIFNKKIEINEDQGWKIEIINSQTQEKEGIFETKYQRDTNTTLLIKEKILTSDNRSYLISITAMEKDWSSLEADIDKILDSAKIK